MIIQKASDVESALSQEQLFDSICSDIHAQGYSIKPYALDESLALTLENYAQKLQDTSFYPAGVGRDGSKTVNPFVRSDRIHWLGSNNESERLWLDWAEKFKTHLNRRLFLGLFSFESHFAWYQKGQFYKRHTDAFQGNSNRVLSLVVYLNHNWQVEDGGELVLYKNDADNVGINVLPTFATIVTFLSEEFPHEVLPSQRGRLSIAGWFSVNGSINGHIDPPA